MRLTYTRNWFDSPIVPGFSIWKSAWKPQKHLACRLPHHFATQQLNLDCFLPFIFFAVCCLIYFFFFKNVFCFVLFFVLISSVCVASAWLDYTVVVCWCVNLFILFASFWKRHVLFTSSLYFLSSFSLFWVCRVVTWAVHAFGRSFTLASWVLFVYAYSLSITFLL